MGGEEVCFWLFLFDLEGIKSFAYISTSGIKILCSSLSKFIWWVILILTFLKMILKKIRGLMA
jgi:hypothetical protein